MSTFEIKMPKLGESITEGTIISWSVKVGDIIREDSVLFEVNTAKVSAEIPAPIAGKITQILVKEGETVAVGTVVAIVDTDATADDNTVATAHAETEAAVTPPTPAPAPMPATPKSTPVQAAASAKPTEEARWYSPVVLQMSQEAGIAETELQQVKGTGYLGRLTKKDLNDYISQKKKGDSTDTAPVVSAQTATPPAPKPAETAPIAKPERQTEVASPDYEIKEMDYVRRIIANHMVMSKNVSAHVTNVLEADVTRLVRWRENNKDTFQRQQGIPLTYMPAITQATARALAEFPTVNASVEGYKVILKKHINIGIAVSLPDDNLIVPVIHDANRMNVNGLALAIESLAGKARSNKLQPAEIEGGTFTITNFGSFKSLFGTPIINQPQIAILGVGYIEKKPAVVTTPEGDTIAIRHKMYLSLSFDHRIIDGALGSKFLRRIADYLEDWNG